MQNLRRRVHELLYPVSKFLSRAGITPNVITSLSIILIFPACYLLIIHEKWFFLAIFAFVAFLDALDGAVAANSGMTTKFGAFYDAFADRIVEGCVYFSIAIAYENLASLAFLALILSYLTSYVAAWEKSVKYTGMGSRAGRLIVLIASFALDMLYYGLIVVSALAAYTILLRLHYLKKRM